MSLAAQRSPLAKFAVGAGILYRANPLDVLAREDVEFECQKCGSTDLKKVSLVYQDGLSKTKSRSRHFGFLLGTAGPAIVTGRSIRYGTQQSVLSRSLNPPAKWSYARLVARFFVISCFALFAYIVFVSASNPPVSTLPVKLYVFLAPVAFLVCLAVLVRHNRFVYPRQYAQWDHSFLCQRCGTLSIHNS